MEWEPMAFLVSIIYQDGKKWTGRYFDEFYLEGLRKKV